MLLVPRQLRRVGMTGNVPYYGGRLTPAQAYAASHPGWVPGPGAPGPMPMATGPLAKAPVPVNSPSAVEKSPEEKLQALEQLLDTGVLTEAEYDDLRARIAE